MYCRYMTDWWRDRCIAICSGICGLIAAIAELIGGQAGGYAFASLVAVSTRWSCEIWPVAWGTCEA